MLSNKEIKNILSSCASGALLYFDLIKNKEAKKRYSERVKICKSCSIYSNGVCQPKEYRKHAINKELEVHGCGCLILCKAAKKHNKCPAQEWDILEDSLGSS